MTLSTEFYFLRAFADDPSISTITRKFDLMHDDRGHFILKLVKLRMKLPLTEYVNPPLDFRLYNIFMVYFFLYI